MIVSKCCLCGEIREVGADCCNYKQQLNRVQNQIDAMKAALLEIADTKIPVITDDHQAKFAYLEMVSKLRIKAREALDPAQNVGESCVCGDPDNLNAVHRKDGPCHMF